jgi:hypothetical protein
MSKPTSGKNSNGSLDNHTQTRRLKPYFEFYVDGKLVAAGSLKEAIRKKMHALSMTPPLKINGVKFQATRTKSRRYRLLVPFTLFGDLDGEVIYRMTRNDTFDLLQSVAKTMPSQRALLMETCK